MKSPASLCARYIFDKNSAASHGAYFKLIKDFTESFPWQTGWELKLCFSQKVELRKLGMVGGAYGLLYWTNPEDIAMNRETYEFMLMEHETNFDEGKSTTSMTHALHRDIQVHLMSRSGELSKSMINILQTLDERFSLGLPDCKVYLACKKCPTNTTMGFPLENGFRPKPNFNTCISEYEHEEHELDCMELWFKQFNLEDFLNNGINSIEKKPFHQVKKDIQTGDQLWVYRDPTSTSCNPIASTNPYAHVVVVVGLGMEMEVVHVAKNPRFWKGFCMGTIKKVPIETVIADDDKGKFSTSVNFKSLTLA